MPFFLILIAAIIAIAAFNDAQGTLATELEQDIPPFGRWALAVFGVGALGWVPGMQTISRYLLALVFVVLIVRNYQQIIQGFQNATCSGANLNANAQGSASASAQTPATAYIANPNAPQITSNEITGTGSVAAGASSSAAASINAAGIAPQVSSPYGAFDPSMFLAEFAAGFGGFGGVA